MECTWRHADAQWSHGRQIGDELLTQQEQVIARGVVGVERIRTVDRQDVRIAGERTRIVNIDDVLGPAGAKVHHYAVRAFAAIDVQRVLNCTTDTVGRPVMCRGQGGQMIDGDQIIPCLPEDLRVTHQIHRLQ